MIIVAYRKKYTKPEMTKTGFYNKNNLQLQGDQEEKSTRKISFSDRHFYSPQTALAVNDHFCNFS